MKTENFVISLIVVGAICFFLGRLSMPVGDAVNKSDKADATAQKTDDAKDAKSDAPAKAEAGAQGGAAAAAKASAGKPAPKAVAAKPRALKPGQGQIAVIESPFKGPKDAKVTIMEISDFQ